ncbi:hypothetical protein ES332_A05G156300v1 [Gossypium tomentosum]|uniref:Uncharacterized protein n=1 Tax=Gossypium tomentosum TaxID=34277 RepID=A0A5D2QFK8_GOSTO|nr:hypothetical protein ES332_A05G156300v1 [Gossypium tomentosum]
MGTILNMSTIISAILYQILVIQLLLNMCSAKEVPAIFAFGDSLYEVGNNFYLDTLAKPTLPNGIDFTKGKRRASGRYTNARTILDIIGKPRLLSIVLNIKNELGFTNYTPPYLSPQTTGDVILKGVNYASSGSGIFNSTGSKFGDHICMDEPINNFEKSRQDIVSKIGAAAARKLFKRCTLLYGNRVYNLDARKIAVTSAAPLGCIPFERDKFSIDDCVPHVNELAKLYNVRLKILLSELTKHLAGSIFIYMNSYTTLEDVLQNYKSYGFMNADSACCRVYGKHGGKLPCIFYARVCPNRTQYVFWDAYHPTEKANFILAKHALDGSRQYISPINIRQLANS